MKKLKDIVYLNIRKIVVITMTVILLLIVFVQILETQNQTKNNAKTTFAQIRQIMKENTAEIETIQGEYRETCLLNAEVVSYIIKHNPEMIGDVEQFRLLAKKIEVDEIHIFDDTGRIFTGSHPEYYNYTFDSGEQIGFFKPLLTDKSLRLCQDITPNTAEGRNVQYSALWSADKKYIVQIGMYPDTVLKTTKKNELSYIFSLLKGNPGISLYAIDKATGKIVGSTTGTDNEKTYTDIGFKDIDEKPKADHLTINDTFSYCIFEEIDDTAIAYVISVDSLYDGIVSYTLILLLCLFVIAFAIVKVIMNFTDGYIVSSISQINEKLRAVTQGDLDERVEVDNSAEFQELSNHINNMINSLVANADKMGFILKFTNMPIGIYEYNKKRKKKVRFTERISQILGIDENTTEALMADHEKMQSFVDDIKKEPISGMDKTYHIKAESEKYVRMEELVRGNDIFGIVIDVTDDVLSLKRVEEERDLDALTGLYNRGGMNRIFDKLFYSGNESLENAALIVIDLDDMKNINDTYGHLSGDIYLQGYAKMLKEFKAPQSIAARLGGDEFVLVVYGYENEEDVDEAFSQLRQMQDSKTIWLDDKTEVVMKFSFGSAMLNNDNNNITKMIAVADEYMYNSKRLRKRLAKENEREEN